MPLYLRRWRLAWLQKFSMSLMLVGVGRREALSMIDPVMAEA